jgi:hypothetical protein
MDLPSLFDSLIPGESITGTTGRDADIPEDFLSAVSLLGVCG